VPGERAWPTQPHPTKTAAYDYQGYVESDLIDFTPELRAEAIAMHGNIALGPLFTPASEIKEGGTKGTWYNPGGTGGRCGRAAASIPKRTFYIPRRRVRGSFVRRIRNRTCDSRADRAPISPSKGCAILKPPYSRDHGARSQHGDS